MERQAETEAAGTEIQAEMMAAGQGGRNGGGRKADLGCVLEIELMGFPDGLDVGCERKRGVRHNMKVYGLCSWKNEVVRS